MTQRPDPIQPRDPSASEMPEIDPLERLSRGLTQWERELLQEPRSSSRSRVVSDLDRITQVLQAARSVTGTLDLNELLVRVVDSLIQVADPAPGFLTSTPATAK